MKLEKYLNSGQKFVIQDEDGNILACPAYLEGVATHYPENDESYSFFDTPEKVSKDSTYFIQDHRDILQVDIQHHPEQRCDEIYMGNVVNPFVWSFYEKQPYFDSNRDGIGWKSKRYGEIAYDRDGEVIKNMLPCFVLRKEIEQAIKSKELDIEMHGDKAYGAKDTIRVLQTMLDKGTVFDN